MKLKQYCEENNINCSTCSHVYKNFISETEWNLYCDDYGLTREDIVCIDWTNEAK